MIEPGKLLQQRYRIERQIGQGGMGAVYIATDERFGSTVAIKETLFMDDSYRKAIEREARLLNSLRHPALPRVSDHFEEDNGQFLVMEYIPGEDLSHMMESSGKPFPVDRVLTWADQLLDALEFLHTQSIPVVHRDIKPQNLKLTARGQIILLDFGLAKGNPTDAAHRTAAKSIFGYSRNYASLEQIQGTGTDPRSDLYSLAATLYHLLTGTPPEDALTRAMAILSKRPDPLLPASSVRPEIPLGVSGVLLKALDLNADGRQASAAEMRAMLRDHESYAYLVDEATAEVPNTVSDVRPHETNIKVGQTMQSSGGQTDVKTRLMSPVVSRETAVRPTASGKYQDSVKRPSPLRFLRVIPEAVAVLLVAACALAGIYYFKPSVLGLDSKDTVEPWIVPAPQTNPEPTVQAAQAENAPPSDNSDTTPEAATGKPRSAPAATAGETARKATSQGKTKDSADPSIVIDERNDTVYLGNVNVKGNPVPPTTYIDENGVTRPIPPIKGELFPGLTKEQFKALSPEAQRKVLEARKKLLMLQRMHPPVPEPPKQQ